MALPNSIDPATPLGSDAKKFGDDQIRAFKQAVIDIFGLPTASPVNVAPFNVAANGTLSNLSQINGPLLLNASSDPFVTAGLVIDQGTNDNLIVAFRSTPDVAQPISDAFSSPTFGAFGKVSPLIGGLAMYGLTDAASVPALLLEGFVASGNTVKTASASPSVLIAGAKADGGGNATVLSSGENLFGVSNGTNNVLLLMDANGSLRTRPGNAGVTPSASFDDLVIEGEPGVSMGISMLTPTNTRTQTLAFGDPQNPAIGRIVYDHSIDTVILDVNASTSLLSLSQTAYTLSVAGAQSFQTLDANQFTLSAAAGQGVLTVSNTSIFGLTGAGVAQLQLTDSVYNVTVGSELTVHADVGRLMVGTVTNNSMIRGITIDAQNAPDEAFAIQHDDSSHGMTSITDTRTLFRIEPRAGSGGATIQGLSSTLISLDIVGAASTGDTDKDQGSSAPVEIRAVRKSGTSTTSMSTNQNLFVIRNAAQTNFIVDAEGDVHVRGSGSLATFDDYNDVELLTAARATLMPDCDFKRQYSEWVDQYAPVLAAGKVITYNKDGQHFVSYKGLNGLLIDTIRQLADRVAKLERN